MNLQEAILARHSVRAYQDKALPADVVEALRAKINEVNEAGGLHVQLVLDEPKAFSGLFSYGVFRGVRNYFVMVGRKSSGLDERIGYYGEQLVLLAQQLGLNTCWVGLTFSKVKSAFAISEGEKLVCVIALGYGESAGASHKIKTADQVSNVDLHSPAWFRQGVEGALLAPTAVNQQKFRFELRNVDGGKPKVKASAGFSFVGYSHVDLGIAKFHFEVCAGPDTFVWA